MEARHGAGKDRVAEEERTDVAGKAERRAAAFRKVREAHQTEVAEDYVELIGDLIAEQGEARLTDLADHTGVTLASASSIIKRLQREGLVATQRYRSLFLTEAGAKMADESRERHRVVQEFFLALGVDPLTAEADAEGVEHHVSDETLEALARLTERLNG